MSQTSVAIDPRGLRFGAAITSAVLVAVILAPSGVKEVLLVLQALTFAIGAFFGPAATPQAKIFSTFVRPRLAPPVETEDSRPPQFAQAVGLAFTAPAAVLLFLGFGGIALVLVGFALAAALLNATTGFCLGCEMYLVTRRLAKQIV